MPRSATGQYTLPIAAFVPGGLIKSSDHNANYGDIATALTQSLATTGVSTMTGPLIASAGLVTSPGYAFNGATKTGFYLAGANQIGWAANGVQGASFNADGSVVFNGNVTIGGVLSASAIPLGTMVDYAGTVAPPKWLLCFGQLVSTTTYSGLFAAIGTTFGSGSGTFGIPDCRGRATFGQDNMGGSAAGRITAGGLNFDGTVLGNSGGGQNQTLTLAQIPTITSTGGISVTSTANAITPGASSASLSVPGSSPFYIQSLLTSTGNASLTSNTSSGPHTILSPAIITNKIIYAGV